MFQNKELVLSAIRDGFKSGTILVVGDVLLDRYLWGQVNRISPEAPVPILSLDRQTHVGGGAANVALNLSGLGISVSLAGYVGNDADGQLLLESLAAGNVLTDAIVTQEERPTISKTRVIGNQQQMLRIDNELLTAISDENVSLLLKQVRQQLDMQPAVVILSDYAKGTLTSGVTREIISLANQAGIPILVDPKGKDFKKYTGATAISPNRQELAAICNVAGDELVPLMDAGNKLRDDLELEYMVLTLGAEGIALLDHDHQQRIPAVVQEVSDVSGAGDTVIATLAAGIASGFSRLDATHLANIAGGIVVSKVGTAPVYRDELLAALEMEHVLERSSKICEMDDLIKRTNEWRHRNLNVVFTNGCFDILHAGHVSYLNTARSLGSKLVVGLNTDRSVTRLKGPSRPIMGEQDRARVLAGLGAVDAICFFDEDTPLKLIEAIKPNILAKGADYSEDQVVGAQEVQASGGKVVLIPLVENKSTTQIIEKVQSENTDAS
ncbi:D-glycero-beta-D-manno-heptose-7-phosphate kinase [Candidatus Neomarinimicrobiota bacterium]